MIPDAAAARTIEACQEMRVPLGEMALSALEAAAAHDQLHPRRHAGGEKMSNAGNDNVVASEEVDIIEDLIEAGVKVTADGRLVVQW